MNCMTFVSSPWSVAGALLFVDPRFASQLSSLPKPHGSWVRFHTRCPLIIFCDVLNPSGLPDGLIAKVGLPFHRTFPFDRLQSFVPHRKVPELVSRVVAGSAPPTLVGGMTCARIAGPVVGQLAAHLLSVALGYK